MAFNRAAGYTNLAQGNFTPVIYSQKVLKFFRRESVVEDVTNTDYFGEISNFGDTVKIINEPTITVASYARGQVLQVQDLVDNEQTVTVDKANSFAFKVDDIEEKHAHTNWQTMAISSAAYSLKDQFDKEIFDYVETQANANTTYGDITTGAIDLGYGAGEVSPYAVINRLNRLLDDQSVPTDNRCFVADPEFWEIFKDENAKMMAVDQTGDSQSPMRHGRISNAPILGTMAYRSLNLPTASTTISSHTDWTANTKCAMMFHKSAVCTASQIAKTEVIRDPDSFSDVVRGLHLYGREVLRSGAVGIVYYRTD